MVIGIWFTFTTCIRMAPLILPRNHPERRTNLVKVDILPGRRD
ncbi:hypothetical protein cce_5057 [Crocosphaera subtropica ATCC 51142]|uniref:Uncharacterized protein n=1 Tax=Crocosphaera subtropica (strain ATCC 51142 / BH68) TaxID=43989 RepID=B1X2P2_CROS5|nr:hypothetical protein cce_5057 [Crocosphaera subtropica ATCC 51142]